MIDPEHTHARAWTYKRYDDGKYKRQRQAFTRTNQQSIHHGHPTKYTSIICRALEGQHEETTTARGTRLPLRWRNNILELPAIHPFLDISIQRIIAGLDSNASTCYYLCYTSINRTSVTYYLVVLQLMVSVTIVPRSLNNLSRGRP